MSFYGSIYYQLVDAFNRIWINNKGQKGLSFPEEENLINPDRVDGAFEYHSPGRQGVIALNSGNRWISFTQNNDNAFDVWHQDAGNGGYFITSDTEKDDAKNYYTKDIEGNFILFEGDNFTSGEEYYENTPLKDLYGFQKLNNIYLIVPEEDEEITDAIKRIIPTSQIVAGTKAVIAFKNDDSDNLQPSEVYEYNNQDEWIIIEDNSQDIILLSPDDFFMTTEISGIDAAGHIIPGEKKYYKMPKSDVTTQIENLWSSVEDIEKVNEDQQEDIDRHEEYVGDWSKYRGYIFPQYDDDGNPTVNHWVPTLASVIGYMSELINGENIGTTDMSYWENQDVTIVKAIGSLSDLFSAFEKDLGLTSESKLTDISLVKAITHLKDSLTAQIAANASSINTANVAIEGLDLRVDKLEAADIEFQEKLDKEIEERKAADEAEQEARIKRDEELTELITDLEDDLNAYKESANAAHTTLEGNINAHIDSVNASFNTTNALIESNKTALEGQISSLRTELNEIIATNRSEVDAAHNELSDTVTDNKALFDALNEIVTNDLTPRLATAESDIVALQEEDDRLEGLINDNKTLAQANTQAINALPTAAEVDQKIANAAYDDSTIQASIQNIENNYLTKVDASNTYALKTQIEELQGQIDALLARIEALETPADSGENT